MSAISPKSRKPKDTAFKQQRLSAWHPILTPNWVIATFLVVGACFMPIGIVLLDQSNSIVEEVVQYDGGGTAAEQSSCKLNDDDESVTCTIEITASKKMEAPIYIYYQLDNFYQNHRRYVKSRSNQQLMGEHITSESELSDCDPLITVENGDILSPCGLIANSFFNDVINLTTHTMSESDISWKSDRDERFNQPDGFRIADPGSDGCAAEYKFDSESGKCYFYPDDDKIQYLYETYPGVISPIDGVTDEHFIVWMRTAGLPNFRKLYGRIETDIEENEKLSFDVTANFEVSSFDGKKYLVVSTTSWFGGKNLFLGVAYIAISAVCLLLAMIFTVKQMLYPRKLGDTRFLGWKEF